MNACLKIIITMSQRFPGLFSEYRKGRQEVALCSGLYGKQWLPAL